MKLGRRAWAAAPSVRSADAYSWALYKADRIGPARRFSERAMRLGSRDPYFLYHAGMIARRAGEIGAAHRLLARLVVPEPALQSALRAARPARPGVVAVIGRLTALVASTASLLAFGAAVTASPALAHPLGNFTTNQLAQVRIDERQARVHYVLDQAEIPTFQQIQRFDESGNGTIEGAERRPLLDSELAEISSGLELDRRRAHGGPEPAARSPGSAFPRARGGCS